MVDVVDGDVVDEETVELLVVVVVVTSVPVTTQGGVGGRKLAEPLGSVHVMALPAKSLITTVTLPSWYVVVWLQLVVSPWSQTAVSPFSVKIPHVLVLLQE